MNGIVILAAGKQWYQNENAEAKKVKTETKKKVAAVIHPTFEKAANLITDPYWKDLVQKAAYGVFPRCYHLHGDILSFKSRSRDYEQKIDMVNASQALHDIQTFMRSVGNFSQNDIKENSLRKEETTANTVKEPLVWSKIRSMKARNDLICSFTSRMQVKHSLSASQVKQLENILRMGIIAGIFNESSVHLVNDEIHVVEGLTMVDSVFTVDDRMYDIYGVKAPKRKVEEDDEEEEVQEVIFLKQWRKLVISQNKTVSD